jgi:TP901 family phage tail tape measure protein
MPAALKVPTIFTAVDRITGVVQRMERSVGGFAGKASIGVNALNRGINNLIPSFGRLAKQALGFTAGYAIFQGLSAGGDALVTFEKNVAGLRVVLDDLNDQQFEPYKRQIIAVAKAMRVSAVDVAGSFEKIAELNFDLAGTPDGLAKVATSAITLARAARLELTPATEGLIAIMSQFDVPATQADRLSNALAAGFKYGSASIEDQIESYKGFGTVAKEANVTMEQSIALTQTLAKYQLKGAEAGTALRSAIIHLQNAGAGYKSGKFSLNDALDEMRKKLASLKNDKSRDAFLNALFGIRAVTQGRLLGRSADLMADLTKNVSGTNEVFKQASITTETFASKWEQLKGSIATYLVSNDSANKGLERLKGIIVYVTNNLDKIIDRIITFGKIFLWVKGIIYTTQAALFLYNTYLGVMGALTGVANIAIGESSVALAAYRTTLLLTGGTMSATAATSATVAGGMGTVTSSFVAANGAAASFFATLSSFVVPAALVALGGLSIWKMLEGNEKFRAGERKLLKKENFNLNSPVGKISPFGNPTQEKDYQAWWLKSSQSGMPSDSLNRVTFDKKFGERYNSSIKSLSTILNNKESDKGEVTNKIQIEINDPGNNVKTVKSAGSNTIPVKVTPTTGIK